jgi:hypothetical protein
MVETGLRESKASESEKSKGVRSRGEKLERGFTDRNFDINIERAVLE